MCKNQTTGTINSDPDVRFGGSYYNDFTVESGDLRAIDKSNSKPKGNKSAIRHPIGGLIVET